MPELDLIDLFRRGGFFMWPILLCSVVAVAVIIDRLVVYARQSYRAQNFIEELRAQFGEKEIRLPLEPEKNPLHAITATYLENADAPDDERTNILQRTATRLIRHWDRRLRMLSTIASLSPLMGLLGTVWGMVLAFSRVEELGSKVTPGDMAGGIWGGLLTTVFGLIVAIPAVAAANWFERKIEKLAHDINEVVSNLDEWRARHRKERE